MPWVCPQDGCHTENRDAEARCGVCGTKRIARRVALVGPAGKSLDVGIDTPIGRDVLAEVAEGEQRFAAVVQFLLLKTADGWNVAHEPAARNPTCYQGAPVAGAAVPLEDGGVLSIGRDHCKLTVRFQY